MSRTIPKARRKALTDPIEVAAYLESHYEELRQLVVTWSYPPGGTLQLADLIGEFEHLPRFRAVVAFSDVVTMNGVRFEPLPTVPTQRIFRGADVTNPNGYSWTTYHDEAYTRAQRRAEIRQWHVSLGGFIRLVMAPELVEYALSDTPIGVLRAELSPASADAAGLRFVIDVEYDKPAAIDRGLQIPRGLRAGSEWVFARPNNLEAEIVRVISQGTAS